ncbi:hypothetical protein CHARACLAT_025640 [Characodon lateralis]|uniref:Uncharacterized protein n=1 Tax=Characodon lateralis TaxID=208331 RepID=A0ABU7DUU2_9TELE|nr:hypothetical protein [Characodon lateralis]
MTLGVRLKSFSPSKMVVLKPGWQSLLFFMFYMYLCSSHPIAIDFIMSSACHKVLQTFANHPVRCVAAGKHLHAGQWILRTRAENYFFEAMFTLQSNAAQIQFFIFFVTHIDFFMAV